MRALEQYVTYHNKLFPRAEILQPVLPANKPLRRLPLLLFTPKRSVREAFQLVLVAFGLVYLVLLVAVIAGWVDTSVPLPKKD